MRIEARQMFRPNGLIDDLVVYGKPEDYLLFADYLGKAVSSEEPISMASESDIVVEITREEAKAELFTSLQNEQNEYFSFDDWNNRTILRIYGSGSVLSALQSFLRDLAGRGNGYSYISEYSERYSYARNSPEWRLHVEIT
ncbi:hypothetical protein [Marinobacter mangrovi]|uniref:hypothetical protein n=1 Tax=Marinobacter mangrovi TaxID=2803918 RepID=UPI001932F769|nr:hypothetical protein [Marinobacter mangrovi]